MLALLIGIIQYINQEVVIVEKENKSLTFLIEKELHKELKFAALKHNTSMKEILAAGAREWLKQNNKQEVNRMNDYIELTCDSNKDDYLTANKIGKDDVIVTVIRG